jgi:hypothetical protein
VQHIREVEYAVAIVQVPVWMFETGQDLENEVATRHILTCWDWIAVVSRDGYGVKDVKELFEGLETCVKEL